MEGERENYVILIIETASGYFDKISRTLLLIDLHDVHLICCKDVGFKQTRLSA